MSRPSIQVKKPSRAAHMPELNAQHGLRENR
jgi:hypothetical protein